MTRNLVLSLPPVPILEQMLQRLMVHRVVIQEMLPMEGSMLTIQIIPCEKKHRKDSHVAHLPPYRKMGKETERIECSVCYEALGEGEYVRELPLCKHVFHKKCVDRWMKQDSERMSCPLCRTCHHRHNVIQE